ncbi:MAG: hypothetical protein H0U50_03140 [Pyrinomonadaceae bacterium]|nr:hypothetical protein [Pyrinomonadaceae bacterium]
MTAKILTLFFVILFAHSANPAQASDTKMLSIGLNASGEILIISPDGKKLGYDVVTKKTYDEIKGATISTSRDREPVYKVPISNLTGDLTIRVFGKTRQTKGDLGISGNGFILRTIGLALEPRKVFTIILRPDLSKIQFSANAIVENPTFNLAIDPPTATDPSYIFKLTRTKLALKKTITIALDLTAGTLNFSDNGLPKNIYSLQATKIDTTGAEKNFANPKIISTKANRFQFDFKNWDEIINGCLKIDENADGFGDEKCEK